MTRFCHLIDDTGPGGVMRTLDFICTAPAMADLGTHEIVTTPAGLSIPPRMAADIIVSHVVLSWRNLPFFAGLRARYPRTTIVHVEHHYSPAFEAAEVTHPFRFRHMLRMSMALFDRVVAISTAQADWLRACVGISDGVMRLIPPCVALEAFLAVPAPSQTIRRIGAIGRLHPQKGFDILIPAFRAAALPGVTLDVFGDGPDHALLQELAENDPAVVFHGHVADPVAALRSVDAVAMPSRREPYGLVALEAMAAGRPLLVSCADGLLDHAANGAIAVETLSVAAWTNALRDLHRAPDMVRAAAGKAEVKQAEERFARAWAEMLRDTGTA